jgi:hypothetical protein
MWVLDAGTEEPVTCYACGDKIKVGNLAIAGFSFASYPMHAEGC